MKGWFNQGWRHSLAAKGVPTRISLARKPLITNDEIAYINRNSGKEISVMTDSEIAEHVAKIRGKRTMTERAKDAMSKVDWLEPIKTASEKGEVGSIIEDEANGLREYAKAQMEIKGIEVFDRDFIDNRYISPILNDFKNGTIRSVDEAKSQIDSKIQYNAPVTSNNPVLSFAAKEEEKQSTWGNIETEQQGPGMLNFIDRASLESVEQKSNLSEEEKNGSGSI